LGFLAFIMWPFGEYFCSVQQITQQITKLL